VEAGAGLTVLRQLVLDLLSVKFAQATTC